MEKVSHAIATTTWRGTAGSTTGQLHGAKGHDYPSCRRML